MADFRGMVSFETIAKTYPTDTNIDCVYVMKEAHNPSAYDWIGLFKVGWSSIKDTVYYHWVPLPDRTAGEEYRGTLVFQASILPKDDGEFYQFAYFNGKKKMCGASSPFQFRAPRSEDFVEEDMPDDEEMLLITTKQVQLEENLNKLEDERRTLSKTCEELSAENNELRNQCESLKARLQEMEFERDSIRISLEALKVETEVLNQKADDSENTAAGLKEAIADAEQKKASADEKLTEQSERILQLQNELDAVRGEVENVKREKELHYQYFTAESSSKQEALRQVEELKQNLAARQIDSNRVQMLEAALRESEKDLKDMSEELELRENRLSVQEDKLDTVEARHQLDKEELSALSATLEILSQKIETVQGENYEYKQKIEELNTRHQTEKADWDVTLDELAKEKNGLLSKICELTHAMEQMKKQSVDIAVLSEQEAGMVALRTAYDNVKARLAEKEKELGVQRARAAKLKDADKQIQELQQKIAAGEQNWKRANQSPGKSAQSGDASERTTPGRKPSDAASKDELTREELQKMVEQLNSELELRTQKKDKYKIKYLEEKQRAAAMRDYYKEELEKQNTELFQLRRQTFKPSFRKSPSSPVKKTSTKVEKPVVEPGNGGSAKQQLSSSKGAAKSKDSDAQNLIEEIGEKVKLPAPIKPQIVPSSASGGEKDQLRVNLDPVVTSPTQNEPPAFPKANQPEVLVMNRQDSDDENEGPERFHDAQDNILTSLDKCFICDKTFSSADSPQDRNDHANGHFDPAIEPNSLDLQKCPVCTQVFPKNHVTPEAFEQHVQSHFAETNYTPPLTRGEFNA